MVMKFQTGDKRTGRRKLGEGQKGKRERCVCERVGMNQQGLQTGMHYSYVRVLY